MSEINLPPRQQECIKAVDTERLQKLVSQCLYNEDSTALRGLRLESCGDYVAAQFRIFERALANYGMAKSVKKRTETEQDALRAGSALVAAVEDMQGRVETEETEGQLFFVDDDVMQPFGSSNNLSVSVRFRWRALVTDPWNYGDIKFTHRSEPVPSYLSHQPKRKGGSSALAMERQRELDREWDYLRRQALHSVKDFFKQGGNGDDVPATFQAKVSPHGGGLNNHSLRFWP